MNSKSDFKQINVGLYLMTITGFGQQQNSNHYLLWINIILKPNKILYNSNINIVK